MTKAGKDSEQVVRFMRLFARMKDLSDDSPEHLTNLAATDPGFNAICNDLSVSAFFLERSEMSGKARFTAPVDPAFLRAWRDYENRYQAVLSGIFLEALGLDISGSESAPTSKWDQMWQAADGEAEEQANAINNFIHFAKDNADQEHRWEPDFAQRLQDGIDAWEGLKDRAGLDLRGMFRRRALVPFVLVPRKVAAKHGGAEKLTMLENLRHAHDAFIFGATHGALALMRSVMEGVLRDHYGTVRADPNEQVKLGERIDAARDRLPPGANAAALHRLRDLANAVLHLDRKKYASLGNMNEQRLEREIISLLGVLRELIEGVK